ncbi:RagB/SusD family nutrient uptake outer membrane protein [Dinghuibacter silviterrae]|uniref:SusD-like starch-binding protein associating with outer membrane n=1 Tax=Dinghuibacter silviterrae TaxID=1539049 RepID=A0A4R8DWE9_9BACT|nr:RagB/SusD family nutrient uptake outer membrane protein [Dinghuibacter silviterrae]TDX01825.1 SusD-like starch-binding protein associating with outer membrane [Dinghuibacter silviterrae]
MWRTYKNIFNGVVFLGFLVSSCNKLVQVPEPISSVTTSEIFSNQGNAISAITGIYSQMSYGRNNTIYSNSVTTQVGGLSSDEIELYSANGPLYQFQSNLLLSNNAYVINYLWSPIYFSIYQSNAAIEGLKASTSLSSTIKTELDGEARFIRAYCYFYLINLFGDVPLVTSTDWTLHQGITRTPASQIYTQIEEDLLLAQSELPGDYSLTGGQKIWANSWAATSMLARVYLYEGKWNSADSASSAVISSGMFTLTKTLDSVFLPNSTEAILQLQVINNPPYATQEGNFFIPPSNTSSPRFYISSNLLASFEMGDARRFHWLDSSKVSGVYYYYPYKYKIRQGTKGAIGEAYMLLRFAEQYLIRAEARAQENNNLSGAISDLNIIRNRVSLGNLSNNLSQAQVLLAVEQERRIELFAEWGHRWLDLKRWGNAAQVLTANKGFTVTSSSLLFPIPLSELQTDPELTQNEGY